MKRILIVDDEPFIAKSIQLMIEASHEDFKVCGVATNGLLAVDMYDSSRPDIVLTDIRMPIMNGLQLIERLSKYSNPPLFIILSGYGEFQYAQQAIKMGVFDYLLKPVEPQALAEVLLRAKKTLDAKYNKFSTNLLWNILNTTGTYPESDDTVKYFGKAPYAFMVLNAGSYFHFSYSPSSSYTDLWKRNDLERFLPDPSSTGGWLISGLRPNEKILLYKADASDTYKKHFKKLYDTLKVQDVPINCTYGIHTDDICTINETISKYRLFLSRNILYGYTNCIFPEKSSQQPSVKLQLSESDKSELLLLFQTGNEQNLLKYISDKLRIYEKHRVRQIDLQFYLLEILYVLNTKLPLNERDQEDLLYFVTDILNNTWSYQMLSEKYLKTVSELLVTIEKDTNPISVTNTVDQIEEYILQHYTENLNLQKLADVFGFVPPYLSRIYKKERGISPSDYILDLKLKRIKHLLKLDSKLSLKTIAENTGFNDSFYMSKVFKLATGMTPSEYRSKD